MRQCAKYGPAVGIPGDEETFEEKGSKVMKYGQEKYEAKRREENSPLERLAGQPPAERDNKEIDHNMFALDDALSSLECVMGQVEPTLSQILSQPDKSETVGRQNETTCTTSPLAVRLEQYTERVLLLYRVLRDILSRVEVGY